MDQSESSSKNQSMYKNPCIKLATDQLYKNRHETGDVKFIIESEEIFAHRCVLASLSPKYNVQFYGSNPDSGDIKVEDVSATAFKEFLQFFYIEDVTFTIDNIEDVLNLAKQSLVEDLVKLCTKFLIDTIKFDRIKMCLRTARFYNLKGLENKCDQFISANIKKLFKSTEFLEYDRDMLIHILKLNTWNRKEIEVFEACMKWAQAKCTRDKVDDANVENIRSALGDAFFNIRFVLMTITEFATIDKQHPQLFTKAEISDVLQQFGKINNGDSHLFNNSRRYCNCIIVEEDSSASFIPSNNLDKIEFSCDKAIDLCGFLMSAGPCNDFKVTLTLDGSTLIRNYAKKIENANKLFQIMFEKPIRLMRNQYFEVAVTFPIAVAQDGYILLSQAEQNGVCFEIEDNYCDARSTISQLLFNRLNVSEFKKMKLHH